MFYNRHIQIFFALGVIRMKTVIMQNLPYVSLCCSCPHANFAHTAMWSSRHCMQNITLVSCKLWLPTFCVHCGKEPFYLRVLWTFLNVYRCASLQHGYRRWCFFASAQLLASQKPYTKFLLICFFTCKY